MKKFKFVDSWTYETGYGSGSKERVIGTFEALNIEDVIINVSKIDDEIDSNNKLFKLSNDRWGMLGVSCTHFITIINS